MSLLQSIARIFGASGTGHTSGLVPDPGGSSGSTKFLREDATWATPAGGGSVANPTASVGLTAVNGSASSAIRSDGAPAIDQSIAPTWTGKHKFSPTLTGSSGTQVAVDFSHVVNMSGTGAFTSIKMYVTETATGSGAHNLIDVGVGAQQVFVVNDDPSTQFKISRQDGFGDYLRGQGYYLYTDTRFYSAGGVYLNALGTYNGNQVVISGANEAAVDFFGLPSVYIDGGASSASSSTYMSFGVITTYNQSSTAAATDFTIKRTETSLGSGDQLFLDFQAGSAGTTRKFAIDNAGNLRVTNSATATVGVGAIAKKMPIYDASGTILGYIPIYSSIT